MKSFLKSCISIVITFAAVFLLLRLLPDGRSGAPISKADAIKIAQTLKGSLVDWKTLREFDYERGVSSPKVTSLLGTEVSIPGYIVPLEDNMNRISEFLLVPSPQACIHVPPPPPNQMVYIKMKKPIEFSWQFRAIWVTGKLEMGHNESPYGQIFYQLSGDDVKPYTPREF